MPIMRVLNFIYIRNMCKIKTQNTCNYLKDCLFFEGIAKIDQNFITLCDSVTWDFVSLKYFKMKYLCCTF